MYILFVFSSHHITTPSSVSEPLPKQMPLLFLCLGFLYGSLHFISIASLSMGEGYLFEQGQLTSCFNIEEYNTSLPATSILIQTVNVLVYFPVEYKGFILPACWTTFIYIFLINAILLG